MNPAGSKPCPVGCTCGRHRPRTVVPYVRTLEHRIKARSKERPDTAERNRLPRSWDTRIRASESARASCGERAHGNTGRTSGNFGFSGAETAFAATLCPAGYVRHYYFHVGPGRYDRYEMDFAHPGAKVNIELDGPYHQPTPIEDSLRDAKLRSLGWRVIRISHG